MRKAGVFFIVLLLTLVTQPNAIFSQAKNPDSLLQFKTIPAGAEYKRKGLYKWFWGNNYRKLWATPVTVKILSLDTAYGGLAIFKADSNKAAKTLHLKNPSGSEYVLTAVNKTPGKLLPGLLRETYIEDRVNDEVSMTNPYSAATIPIQAAAAKLDAPDPVYVFLPKQPALSAYNAFYGDDLYRLAEVASTGRKNETSGTMPGNCIETYQLLEVLNSNSDAHIDTYAFIRERLFDMFINDWNSGEDKWKWEQGKEGEKTIYTPVAKNRDAAYSKYDGKLLRLRLGISGMNYIQSFDRNLENVNRFNFKARNLDRRLLNEATMQDWQAVAADLQRALTDSIIYNAVEQLPKEIFPLAGTEIITKLSARRSHLTEWATQYYYFLSREVEIPGTYQKEEFDIQRERDTTLVRVFRLEDEEKKDTPYYSRKFPTSETKQIRLFGLTGANKFIIKGNTGNATDIKIITGGGNDSVIAAQPGNSKNIVVYGQEVATISPAGLKTKTDTTFKSYRYDTYNYDKKGILPSVFYSFEDRLYMGLGYRWKHYAWGKMPFASSHFIDLHYSLLEKAFSITHKSIFPQLIAKSNLTLLMNYDDVRWTYFFGLGNETKFSDDKKIKYYTVRTRQWLVQPALVRTLGRNTLSVFGSFYGIKVIDDTSRFLNKAYDPDKSVYNWQNFMGAGISYSFQDLNDALVPTKGVYFNTTVTGAQNLTTSSIHYIDYKGTAHFYVPLASKWSLNLRAGAETITGNPQFYQYPSIGSIWFRGVVRDRFRGKTAVYNTNDLRFISPVHKRFFVGKAGFQVFIDDGRVWMPNEESGIWHFAYGAGIILAPFKIGYADFNYGRSKKESTFQVRVTFSVP